ncbi:MAG: glycosyltransferase family 9 protein [Candidatus Dormibacteraeota bacterium]|nr:glycosyltransferase family 9 protein [Candidatus Dormibacteraeota bacterium]
MNVAVVVEGGIAETLQATPLLRTFRAGVPDAHITLLCAPEALAVAGGIAAVDLAVAVPGLRERPPVDVAARAWFQLRRRRYDAVLLCGTSAALRWAVFLSGIPRRLGVGGGLTSVLLTRRTLRSAGENLAASWLRVAALAGIRQELHSPLFEPGPEARREAERLVHVSGFGDGRLLVALAPGTPRDGAAASESWDSERFAHLANLLSSRHGAGIVFLGAFSDRPLVDRILLDLGASAVDLSGQLDVPVTGGVLARCDLLVAGDSFLLHLAAAVGTPAVGLYGPTDGGQRGPYGADHRIIQAVPRDGSPGRLEQIRVEDVLASIEASL